MQESVAAFIFQECRSPALQAACNIAATRHAYWQYSRYASGSSPHALHSLSCIPFACRALQDCCKCFFFFLVYAANYCTSSSATDSAGKLYCQATANNQGQSDNIPPVLPDISLLSLQLQQQWHVDSNMHLGAVKIKPHSRIKAVWHCNECPAGQPHVWTALVSSRTTRSGTCPYCCNRLLCVHNSLATVAPDMA